MRQKISELLKEVKMLDEISEKAAKASHKAANEVSGGLATSYSAAGDAEHARNTANLSMDKAKQIRKLTLELETAAVEVCNGKIIPVVLATIELAGKIKEIYLVENPILVAGFNLVSPASPLGKALLRKSAGESFSYSTGTEAYSGKVLQVE